MSIGRIAVLAWSTLVLSCTGSAGFACGKDEQCAANGVVGLCQPNGYCSFPDPSCPSGQRFGDQAPSTIAGLCVEAEGGSTGPAKPSTGNPMSSDTVAATASVADSTGTTIGVGDSSSSGAASSSSSTGDPVGSSTGQKRTCATQADDDTVAHYRFEESTAVSDETAAHDGMWIGSGNSRTRGPDGCGSAALLDGSTHAFVPDDGAFHLVEGSFDLWIRAGDPPASQGVGIVSRDASEQVLQGHLSLWHTPDGRVAVRQQDIEGGVASRLVCSDTAVPQDVWIHVGVNFGADGLELWIDAEPQAGEGAVTFLGADRSCTGGDTSFGIDGNANPWIFGASSGTSVEGTGAPVDDWFVGAIDEIRISAARREFANGP